MQEALRRYAQNRQPAVVGLRRLLDAPAPAASA